MAHFSILTSIVFFALISGVVGQNNTTATSAASGTTTNTSSTQAPTTTLPVTTSTTLAPTTSNNAPSATTSSSPVGGGNSSSSTSTGSNSSGGSSSSTGGSGSGSSGSGSCCAGQGAAVPTTDLDSNCKPKASSNASAADTWAPKACGTGTSCKPYTCVVKALGIQVSKTYYQDCFADADLTTKIASLKTGDGGSNGQACTAGILSAGTRIPVPFSAILFALVGLLSSASVGSNA